MDRLALDIYEFIGNLHVSSYNHMLNVRLPLYMQNLIKYSGLYPVGSKVEITIDIPRSSPLEARKDNGRSNYNLKLKFAIYKSSELLRHFDLYIPCMIGSDWCLTTGKSPNYKYKLGISVGDVGGYFINNGGSDVVVRIKEIAHPQIYRTSSRIMFAHTLKKNIASQYADTPMFGMFSESDISSKLPADNYVVSVSHEDIFGLTTRVCIFTICGVHMVEFSLPRLIANEDEPSEYAFMAKGVATLRGRLTHVLHLLGLEPDLLYKYCRHSENEIDAIFKKSLKDYRRIHKTDEELLKMFYSTDPKKVGIKTLEDLKEHFTAYCIPQIISNIEGKYYALAALFDAHVDAMHDDSVTDLDSYKNKMYVDSGEIIFRYLRQAIDMRVRTDTELPATSILSSFNTVDDTKKVFTYSRAEDNDPKMALNHGTLLKDVLALSTVVVVGSQHMGITSREIQLESQEGNICNLYTPESEKAGQRKNLASLALLSLYRDPKLVYTYIDDHPEHGQGKILMLNALPMFECSQAYFKTMRRRFNRNLGTFDIVFVEYDYYFQIFTTGGILGHLSLKVIDGNVVTDYNSVDELIEGGHLMFISAMETYRECSSVELLEWLPYETNDTPCVTCGKPTDTLCTECQQRRCCTTACRVCSGSEPYEVITYRKEFDYCQIAAWCMLGPMGNTCPFPHKTYGVRAMYHTNMSTQAMRTSNVPYLLDMPLIKLADCATKPMVASTLEKHITKNEPNGINTLVTIRVLPRNNEDALIITDRAARRLLRYTYINSRKIRSVTKKDQKVSNGIEMCITKGFFHGLHSSMKGSAKYKWINPTTGLPMIGAKFNVDDVVLARYYVTITGEIIDASIKASMEQHGKLISMVVEGINVIDDGTYPIKNTSVRLVFQNRRQYKQGDKLCARPSQKGVVSDVIRAIDVARVQSGPYAGCIPSIFISAAIVPTRQTWSIFTEMYASMYATISRTQQNCNAFNDRQLDLAVQEDQTILKYKKLLSKAGHNPTIDALIDGVETITCAFRYNMLSHHAEDKLKTSHVDPKVIGGDITRTVVSGRTGNLHGGIQEIQGLTAGGASETLHSNSTNDSTMHRVRICRTCEGLITLDSRTCCNGDYIERDISYSAIVLGHIAASRGIQFSWL